jgi:hypothetical protein
MDINLIKKFVDDEYEIINTNYQKSINKKTNPKKIMDKKRDDAVQFLLKNNLCKK